MNVSEVSQRYAKALFDVAKEANQQDKMITELKKLTDLFTNDKEVASFIESPMVNAEAKEKVIVAALKDNCSSEFVTNFVSLLAKKDRVSVLSEVLSAYQSILDEENGVIRGLVRSTHTLTPEEREKITDQITLQTKKRVVLEFKEDSSLIGGLVAEVGSYTFNDTLDSHLTRLNEDLNRSLH